MSARYLVVVCEIGRSPVQYQTDIGGEAKNL